ncbi:MAG: 50S ribosomal protein L13 [Candidatus Gracilibacteria bacterium]|nr:50S ribosomal protein L13 [Candidatus Gracilibacteria bacterium]
MKTSTPTHEMQQDKKWFVIDSDGMTLGRLATAVADILRGKNKPQLTPHMDMGDYVILLNAEKIRITGAKMDQKHYYSHSGYPGHLKFVSLRRVMEKRPERVLEEAVRGMLPKNKLRDRFMTKLHV